MNTEPLTTQQWHDKIGSSTALLLYFSHEGCQVCKFLRPKIENLIAEDFPKIHMHYINTLHQPEVTAAFSVFTVPTLLVFFDGRETIRTSRNIHTSELKEQISRYYKILFQE